MDNLDKIYQEIATEMGLGKSRVRSIAESQFVFVGNTMRKKDVNNVRLQYFGVFKVKPGRLQFLSKEKKKELKEKTDEFNEVL